MCHLPKEKELDCYNDLVWKKKNCESYCFAQRQRIYTFAMNSEKLSSLHKLC